MEEWLETNRFRTQYNLGESGGRARTVHEILTQSHLTENEIAEKFLHIKLHDSPNWGRMDLRECVASFHPGARPENVLITTGTSEALLLLFHTLQPKSIALALPGFQLLYEIPKSIGTEIIPLPVYWDEQGVPFIDQTQWFDILKMHKPSCVLINNPHNPSGLIFEDDFLTELKALTKTWNGTFIGDEHYRFLASETNVLGPTVYNEDEHTFTTGSFIKCLGVPGLRIGWCVGDTEILSRMQNMKNYTTHTVSPITEWISYEVLKNTRSSLFESMKQEWLLNKKILSSFLELSKNIYGAVPQGGLVTSLGFKSAQTLDHAMQAIHALTDQGVFVLPLSSMEVGQFDFQMLPYSKDKKLSGINSGLGFRLGLGISPEQLESALKYLEL